MKSKKAILLVVSIIMLFVAIGFVVFALNNPQASFPWENRITYTIYAIYVIIMVVFFVFSRRKK